MDLGDLSWRRRRAARTIPGALASALVDIEPFVVGSIPFSYPTRRKALARILRGVGRWWWATLTRRVPLARRGALMGRITLALWGALVGRITLALRTLVRRT